ANSPSMVPVVAKPNLLVTFGNRGEAQRLPFVWCALQPASEVIRMPALHHQDDRSRLLVVQAGHYGAGEQVIDPVALRVGVRVYCSFQGIIDDNDVTAAPGQRTIDRCRQPIAVLRGNYFE